MFRKCFYPTLRWANILKLIVINLLMVKIAISLKAWHQYELEFHVDPSGVGFDLVVTVPILVSSFNKLQPERQKMCRRWEQFLSSRPSQHLLLRQLGFLHRLLLAPIWHLRHRHRKPKLMEIDESIKENDDTNLVHLFHLHALSKYQNHHNHQAGG